MNVEWRLLGNSACPEVLIRGTGGDDWGARHLQQLSMVDKETSEMLNNLYS